MKLIRLFKPKFELLLLAALLSCQTARAAVGFTITPSPVSNAYSGTITLLVTGLAAGETVVVQKYLDANTNGVVDAGDILVQQYNLTDGSNMVIGGVTNINVPGDTDTVAGQVTAKLSFQSDVLQTIVGQYLYVLSSPTGLFTPITNSFAVTNYPYAQKFTGTVVSNGVAVPNAGVLLGQPSSETSGLNVVGGAVANDSGVYTIQAPTGTYSLTAFKSNFVASETAAANLVLTNGATINTNLSLIAATQSISGSIVDTNNTNLGLPGLFLTVTSTNSLLALFSTESNGNFTVAVNSNQWKFGADSSSLALLGYVGLENKVQENTTGGSVSNVIIALPKTTGLFYGSVLDNSGNPLPGVVKVYADDQNHGYQSDGYTESNGYYVTAALGLGGGDPWQVNIDNASSFPNYIFSQPNFDTNGGASLNVGQAIQVNFTALLATNQITGYLLDINSNAIPNVGISANATINNTNFQTSSSNTGTNGYYSLNVASGYWSVNVNCPCSGCGGNNNSLPTNYICPNSDNVTVSNNNQVADFTAILATNYISGYLLDNHGSPIAGVGINAGSTNNQMFSSNTGTNGYYLIYVAPGYWSVSVNCPCSGCTGNGFLPTNYLCPNSDNVTVSNNNPVADFTAILATNSISGSLTNNNGSAISGVGITANATISNNTYYQNIDTDGNGHYALNVANGTWSVCVNNCSDCGNGGVLSNIYLSPPCVTVVISNDNGTANFTAIPATNYISGYLTNITGVPITNVGIYADATINGVYYQQGGAQTDSNGHYELNVANGTWSVGVNTCCDCGNGGLSCNYDCSTNQTVVIFNDNGTANFTAIFAPYSISGYLKDNNSNAIPNVGIYANTTISNIGFLQNTSTATNGNYSMNVANGTWMVGVNSCSNCGNGLPGIYCPPQNQTVVISNGSGTADFTVQSGSGVTITTTSLPPGQVNSYYDQYLQASSCCSSFTWSIISNSLPQGLTGNPSTGEIYGTPTNAGTYNFTVQVTDCNGHSTNHSLSIYIAPPNCVLQVTTTSLSNATQNAFYRTTLTASCGQPPYTWGLVPGSASLPMGLSLATNGVISGTPIGSGTSQFIVLVIDAASAWNYQLLALTVNASSIPQVIVLTAPEQLGTNQFQFGFNSASGVDYTIQYSTNLKTWTSLFEFSGSGGTETITDPNAGGSTQRFYRVVVP